VIGWPALGIQHQVVERLFQGYFAEGVDVPRRTRRLAGEAGLDAEEVAEFLASPALEREVVEEDAGFRQQGLSGVPTFALAGHALFSAMPARRWPRPSAAACGSCASGACCRPRLTCALRRRRYFATLVDSGFPAAGSRFASTAVRGARRAAGIGLVRERRRHCRWRRCRRSGRGRLTSHTSSQ
jgi:hypothetical protein